MAKEKTTKKEACNENCACKKVTYPCCKTVSFKGKAPFPVFMPTEDEAFTPIGFYVNKQTGEVAVGWFPVDLESRMVTLPSEEVADFAEPVLSAFGFEGVNICSGADCDDEVEEDEEDYTIDDVKVIKVLV
jgi:hypothetical protein